jgi:hypothetical protein
MHRAEPGLVFGANIRMNPYPVVFQPRLPFGMPGPIESSNQGKNFIVGQVSKSHSSVNRIVSFVFQDGFSGSRI